MSPRLANTDGDVPLCPMCGDVPCAHEFVRSEYRIPDMLPRAPESPAISTKPVKVPVPRGRRQP